MEPFQNLQSLPQNLATKLHQLTLELPIENIYFHPATSVELAHLLIVTHTNINSELIESRKWLRRALKEKRIFFHVLSCQQMHYGYKNGNPFIPAYCTANALVYQSNSNDLHHSTNWKDFKEHYKKYDQLYFNQFDSLRSITAQFFILKARTSVFLSYITLYDHHLTFLERLYIGHSFNNKTLTQRIKYLTQYLPTIEDLFVKQNGETYYLIVQLEKANQAARDADEIYINWNLYTAITEVEILLHNMVTDRFLALKKRIKSNKVIALFANEAPKNLPIDKQLSNVVSQINKIKQPEEIYLFHKLQTASTTHYFLLLIGEGIGTATLNSMQQSITSSQNNTCNLILIAHSRIWIQDNLFIHQNFFKNIMIPKNRVFTTPNKHFTMHWENPFNPYYTDLDYMYKATNKMIAQYFVLRRNATPDNAEGLNSMFAMAILRAFRTIIYATLSYQTHYLSAYNLWMLCRYAQPDIGNLEFLFNKLSGDSFFKMINYNSKFHHGLNRLPEEKTLIMDEILNALTQELKKPTPLQNL